MAALSSEAAQDANREWGPSERWGLLRVADEPLGRSPLGYTALRGRLVRDGWNPLARSPMGD